MKVQFEIKEHDELIIDVCEGVSSYAVHLTVNDDIVTLNLSKKHIQQLIKELKSWESIIE